MLELMLAGHLNNRPNQGRHASEFAGEEMNGKTGQVIEVESAMNIHVLGTEVTEADSSAVASVIKIGA